MAIIVTKEIAKLLVGVNILEKKIGYVIDGVISFPSKERE